MRGHVSSLALGSLKQKEGQKGRGHFLACQASRGASGVFSHQRHHTSENVLFPFTCKQGANYPTLPMWPAGVTNRTQSWLILIGPTVQITLI